MSRLIGVLGLARSGRAAAELALSRGDRVFASDAGDGSHVREAADAIRAAGGEAETGGHSIERLAGCDVLVLSPGIPPTAPVLSDQRLAAVPRVSELEFAYGHLRAPVIAVTGTNGKTTTTALAAHLLQHAGLDAPAAGNIGVALSEIALREPAPDWVVVECSSFQLADIDRFSPAIGVLTNLSPDHLDRYASVEAYYADKARLFENANEDSVWVLNGEDEEVLRLAGTTPGERLLFRGGTLPEPGEEGAHVSPEGVLVVDIESVSGPLVRTGELQLLGAHNRENAMAAALAACAAGASLDAVRVGLTTFRPLEHRLQPVAEIERVLWINDSKATNLDSAREAMRSMTRPTVVLLGGRHKGEAYGTLLPELLRHGRAVVAFGEAAPLIEADLGGDFPVERVDGGMAEVVARAADLARPGDAVLLAPACSSYDMFENYEERGRTFAELVRARIGAEAAHG